MGKGTLLIAVEKARDQVHAAMEALQTLLNVVLNDTFAWLPPPDPPRPAAALRLLGTKKHSAMGGAINAVYYSVAVFADGNFGPQTAVFPFLSFVSALHSCTVICERSSTSHMKSTLVPSIRRLYSPRRALSCMIEGFGS